jgi:hypothetical protein
MEKIKAVALISGGLDSMLAAGAVKRLGIEVHGVNFYTGFGSIDQRMRVDGEKSAASNKKLESAVKKTSVELGIPVETLDISKPFLEMVTNPKHGYGANVNPCIDCKILMLREAHKFMIKIGAKFLLTGEVVGQRPMSQHRNTLRHIEKEAGVAGIVLRPLSAKILEPTLAETAGYIKREDLFAISGRGRNPQLKLVSEFEIKNYPRPGNDCCFLIDQSYAVRFFDLMKHRQIKSVSMDDVIRLRLGRHFRIKETHKIIIGRNEAENDLLEKYAGENMALIKAVVEIGPVGLMEGVFDESDIVAAASIIAGYGKGKMLSVVEFEISSGCAKKTISVKPADPQLYSQFIIQHHSGHGPK